MSKILKNLHWIIIAYSVYSFYSIYMEKDEQLNTTTAKEASLQNDLKKSKKLQREVQNFHKNIGEEKAKIERVAQEIEKTQQLLPSDLSDTENINLLRRLADEVNVKEISIAPEREVDQGFFITRGYNVTAKATFLQFLILFEKISENKRILNVGDCSFKKSTDPQRGKYQIINGQFKIYAYRYNVNFKEDRGIEEIEKKFKSEGTAPKKVSVKKGNEDG
jgi:Tfp pilus assembly protein PilO